MPAPETLFDVYQIVTPRGLLGGYDLKTLGTAGLQQSSVETVVQLLMGHENGGVFTLDDAVQQLNETSSPVSLDDVNKAIRIFTDTGATIKGSTSKGYKAGESSLQDVAFLEALRASDQEPDQLVKTKLGIVMTQTPNVSLNVRNTNNIAVFLKAIPTLEMTRAVPMLDIRFQLARPPTNSDGTIQVPSLIKFLNGAVKLDANAADGRIASAMAPTVDNKTETMTDMGIFLAPQTLVNRDAPDDRSVRAAPVIDKSRPFASIESANIEVVASPSWAVAYKSMQLHLVLHDRSRLAELADLVRPATYTGTKAIVTYGWTHPDKSGDNDWANLINKMRITEKYGIKNASYSFDAAGQVKITLQLYMLGTNEIYISSIAETSQYKNASKQIEELREIIARLGEQLGLASNTFKETRVSQILEAAEHGERPNMSEPEFVKALADVKKQIQIGFSSSKSTNKQLAITFAKALDSLYGSTGKGGQIEKIKAEVRSQLKNKYDVLQKNPDPFFLYETSAPITKMIDRYIKRGKEVRNEVASLAKIFALFVGQPLQALGPAFANEIQIIFHPFNDYAGLMRGQNIGTMPVKLDYFSKVMTDFAIKRNNPNITLFDFLRLINDSIVQDPRTEAFGLSKLYKNASDPDKPPELAQGQTAASVARKQDEILGASGGTWKQPTLELFIETMPRALANPTGPKTDDNYTVVRLHVYDRQSTPFNAFMQLLKAQSGLQEALDTVNKDNAVTSNSMSDVVSLLSSLSGKAGFSDIPSPTLEQSGLVTDVGTTFEGVKKFVSAAMPSMVLGSNCTGITNVNVQTIQDPMLNTVNQMRAGGGGDAKPNNSGLGGLPLRVIPGQMEMTTIGCPLATLNQQWFIDLGTGTDQDAVYGLTGISHSISAGKFDTSLKFIWMDGYGIYESILTKIQQWSAMLKKKAGG